MEASEYSEDLQPDEGQGAEEQEATSGGLYNLDDVPEEYRPHVESIAKEIDGNVTKKFQEAADYRKQWEPYEELGINDYEPEALKNLLALAEIAGDPEQFKEWWEFVGDEYGWTDEFFEGDEEDNEGEDIYGEDEDDNALSLEEIQQAMSEVVDSRLSPLLDRERGREEEQRMAKANDFIESELAELHDKHGEFPDDTVLKLAVHHEGNDAIKQGFSEYTDIVGNAEKATLQERNGQPTPSEGEGIPNVSQKSPTSFEEATRMARERLSQANQ